MPNETQESDASSKFCDKVDKKIKIGSSYDDNQNWFNNSWYDYKEVCGEPKWPNTAKFRYENSSANYFV